MYKQLSSYLCLAAIVSTVTAFAPLHSQASSTALFGFTDTVKQWNFLAPWTDRPYKGPECVVEIIGADLNEKSNSNFDRFSKPDISVEVSHNKRTRKTQTEGNSFTPRYLWSAKMPYRSNRGFAFTVYENNVVKGDDIMGRAYISAEDAKEMIDEKLPAKLLSIGEGIGVVKVQIYATPQYLKEGDSDKIQLLEETGYINASKGE
mmetsp:Transcript_18778/g.28536  ORF Transcript_18778/g.28536 Transcript_18778/m.28536 type:complete len:205 (+) Transcript_18778:98-712(+)